MYITIFDSHLTVLEKCPNTELFNHDSYLFFSYCWLEIKNKGNN